MPVGVDIHQIAAKVAEMATPEARAKGIEIAVDVRPGTMVDSYAELLTIVLQNLVGNAIKYSNGGTVHIGCDGEHEIGPSALWVSDQGPGIATEEKQRIFDAFTRGDTHGQQGLGLGLAIASQTAELLGSKLSVESKVGVGSTFRLALRPNGAEGEHRLN